MHHFHHKLRPESMWAALFISSAVDMIQLNKYNIQSSTVSYRVDQGTCPKNPVWSHMAGDAP